MNKIIDIELKITCDDNEELNNIYDEIQDKLMSIDYEWTQISILSVE